MQAAQPSGQDRHSLVLARKCMEGQEVQLLACWEQVRQEVLQERQVELVRKEVVLQAVHWSVELSHSWQPFVQV